MIANMIHIDSQPVPTEVFRSECLERIVGLLLKNDVTAALTHVGGAMCAKGTLLFFSAVQHGKLSRDTAADHMVSLIPKATLANLLAKGVNLQADDNQRHFMLDGLESFFQDGDGSFSEAKLTSMLGKETLAKMKELFDCPIEPRFESTFTIDDRAGQVGAGSFEKYYASNVVDRSIPERLAFAHGKKDASVDAGTLFAGAATKAGEALKIGVGVSSLDLPSLTRLPHIKDDGNCDEADMLSLNSRIADAQDITLPTYDYDDRVTLPANSKLWRVAKYAIDKCSANKDNSGVEATRRTWNKGRNSRTIYVGKFSNTDEAGRGPSHRVRLSRASEEMDFQCVSEEARVDLMVAYLVKAGRMTDTDAQWLYREACAARGAKIALDKINLVLTSKGTKPLRERAAVILSKGDLRTAMGWLSEEAQARVNGARRRSSDAERLRATLLALAKELKATSYERTEVLRNSTNLDIEGNDLDAAVKQFFKERFIVVAEQKTNRDFDKMSPQQAKTLLEGGKERLRMAAYAVHGIKDPGEREQARRKILAEEGTILFREEIKGKDCDTVLRELAIRASDLVNWSREARFSTSTGDNQDGQDGATFKGYLNHLSQGLAALLASGQVSRTVYTYGWDGRLGKESLSVERWNLAGKDGKPHNFPGSFPLEAGGNTSTVGGVAYGRAIRAQKIERLSDGQLLDPMERSLKNIGDAADQSDAAAHGFEDGGELCETDVEGYLRIIDRNEGLERDEEARRALLRDKSVLWAAKVAAPIRGGTDDCSIAAPAEKVAGAATIRSVLSRVPEKHIQKERAKLLGVDLIIAPTTTEGTAGEFGRAAVAADMAFVPGRHTDLTGQVVMVSVPGRGRNFQGMPVLTKRVMQALDRGATVRTDNEANATRPSNAEGEGALRAALIEAGYKETPHELLSEWRLEGLSSMQSDQVARRAEAALEREAQVKEREAKLASLKAQYKALSIQDHPIAKALEASGVANFTAPMLNRLHAGLEAASPELLGQFNPAQIRAFELKLIEGDRLRTEGRKLRDEIDAIDLL